VASEDIANQLHRAETLIAVRRFAEAAAIAYEAAAKVPGDPSPCLIAARAELGLGNNKRAEEAAEAAIRYSPELPVAHRLVAMARINSGFKESVRFVRRQWGRSAVDPAKRSVALDPAEAAGYWILAQATAMAGQLKAAKMAADQGARLAPLNAESWRVRAQVARNIGDLKVAESCAREALRLDPQNYAASNELGLVLQRRGKTTESLGQFANTAAIDPTLGPARANMLRHSKQVTYMITLVLLCPLAIVWPLWFAASVGLNRLIWTWAPTRTFLEQRSYARAQRRGHKADSKAPRETTVVPAGAAIKGPYFISTQLLWAALAIIVVFYLLPTTVLTFVHPSRFIGPALGAWVVSVLLFWPIHHRRHSEGQELGLNQQFVVRT
jgi:tetratricopeptide (TPR) repeat protein